MSYNYEYTMNTSGNGGCTAQHTDRAAATVAIRFTPEQSLPADPVERIVAVRVAENEARAAGRSSAR